MRKLLILITIFLGLSFILTPRVFASSGTISTPNTFRSHASLQWTPNQYTSNPYIDPYHYNTCTHDSKYVSGTLYNYNDNSIAASGLLSYIDCDGFMLLNNVNSSLQNNSPYYVVITNPKHRINLAECMHVSRAGIYNATFLFGVESRSLSSYLNTAVRNTL